MFHSDFRTTFWLLNIELVCWTVNCYFEFLSFIPFNNGNSLISLQNIRCLYPLQQVFCVTEALCVQSAGLHKALHGSQFSPQACQDGAWR